MAQTMQQVYRGADFYADDNGTPQMRVNYSYPDNPEYEYIAYMERINFDEEEVDDLRKGKGFIIDSPKATIKKDIKNPNGIFSTRFGQRLGDTDPYIDMYRCSCGALRSKSKSGMRCEKCGTICKEVGEDLSQFGWIEVNAEYGIINPDMYKLLETFFGRSKFTKDKRKNKNTVLDNMLDFDPDIDENGHVTGLKVKETEPYYGIGMIEFYHRFDEIFDFYYNKSKTNVNKSAIYKDINEERDKLFIHSIPVFTTLLRPMDINADTMYYEKTNGYYRMMVSLAGSINKNRRAMDRTSRLKNVQLYRLQMKYMELYDELMEIVSGKKGELRQLVSGRFSFSSRSVIKQNPYLRIDQVELPYAELVITLEQQIINILHRTYNSSYQEAWNKWFKAVSIVDDTIVKIIRDIMKSSCDGQGIPVIVNRNPTISFGSIVQMYCVGINFNYTMSVPLQILPGLAADFDGDVLNIFHIINQDFYERCNEIFNPRNAFYISHNNGLFNNSVNVQRDTLINANALNDLTMRLYTKEEMDHINKIKEKQKLL